MKACLALLLVLALSLCACAAPSETASAPTPAQTFVPLPAPTPAPERAAGDVRIYFDGLLTDRGIREAGTVFLAPDAICAYYDLDLRTEAGPSGFTLILPNLEVSGSRGEEILHADGRYLYVPDGWFYEEGRVYLPADAIARIFGLRVTLSDDLSRADVSTTGVRLLQGGPDYYSTICHADDFYWLTHIIYSEAHYESLAGQIGVGSVVLNRVASDDFPTTITSVVLDREHTLQFQPVGTGEVTAVPDETAVIAACLCLEGYNTVGESMYFVNPERGDDSWFERALTRIVTIGHHQFYA